MCEPKTLAKQCLFRGNNSFTSALHHREQQTRKKLRFHNDNNKSKCKMALRKIPITSTNRGRSIFYGARRVEHCWWWEDKKRLKWWNQDIFWDFRPKATLAHQQTTRENIFSLEICSVHLKQDRGLVDLTFLRFRSISEAAAVERSFSNLKNNYLQWKVNKLEVLLLKNSFPSGGNAVTHSPPRQPVPTPWHWRLVSRAGWTARREKERKVMENEPS